MNYELRVVQSGVACHASAIRPIVARQSTLSDVVAWLATRRGKSALAEVVAQDEFTHDVIVRYEGDAHLVYDVT